MSVSVLRFFSSELPLALPTAAPEAFERVVTMMSVLRTQAIGQTGFKRSIEPELALVLYTSR